MMRFSRFSFFLLRCGADWVTVEQTFLAREKFELLRKGAQSIGRVEFR
jgi:hypothetical protein